MTPEIESQKVAEGRNSLSKHQEHPQNSQVDGQRSSQEGAKHIPTLWLRNLANIISQHHQQTNYGKESLSLVKSLHSPRSAPLSTYHSVSTTPAPLLSSPLSPGCLAVDRLLDKWPSVRKSDPGVWRKVTSNCLPLTPALPSSDPFLNFMACSLQGDLCLSTFQILIL